MVTIPLLIEIENFSTISTENLENYKIFERNCHILVILCSVMCIFINLGKKWHQIGWRIILIQLLIVKLLSWEGELLSLF